MIKMNQHGYTYRQMVYFFYKKELKRVLLFNISLSEATYASIKATAKVQASKYVYS